MKKLQLIAVIIAFISTLFYGACLFLMDGISTPSTTMTVLAWITAVGYGIFLILTFLRLFIKKK